MKFEVRYVNVLCDVWVGTDRDRKVAEVGQSDSHVFVLCFVPWDDASQVSTYGVQGKVS
jgi:hypothetical protein